MQVHAHNDTPLRSRYAYWRRPSADGPRASYPRIDGHKGGARSASRGFPAPPRAVGMPRDSPETLRWMDASQGRRMSVDQASVSLCQWTFSTVCTYTQRLAGSLASFYLVHVRVSTSVLNVKGGSR